LCAVRLPGAAAVSGRGGMTGEVVLDRNGKRLVRGHVLDVLREMPSGSVNCVVTSPPYWGLRAYGTEPQVWGGDPNCPHSETEPAAAPPQTGGNGAASAKQVTNAGTQTWNTERVYIVGGGTAGSSAEAFSKPGPENAARIKAARWREYATCTLCGAWRGELGSEPTPALFVAHLVEIFRGVKRVLRKDGTAWLNIGDSYAGSGKGTSSKNGLSKQHTNVGSLIGSTPVVDGLKGKDLCLIPERLAIALQDDGWYIRSRIAWCKRAPMPESVQDRPTSAWEHIWLLSKSATYYYDADAVRNPWADERNGASGARSLPYSHGAGRHDTLGTSERQGLGVQPNTVGANLRSYWLLSPDPYPEAHFATFPRELPRRCIKAGSRPGDTVLDPFAGSGTTLLVANELGRQAIGIELNPDYCDLALRRLQQDSLLTLLSEPSA
jgi:DNA modification methylase